MQKIWQREGKGGGVIHYIVRTQPAGDASEETVRSVMKVHRRHRLHTKKEERVMLLLVSAYLVLGLQCMPRDSRFLTVLVSAIRNADEFTSLKS